MTPRRDFPRRPVVVVAPDKFKGSLSAAEAAEALAAGVLDSCPSFEVVACPIADGGEGTVAAALAHGYAPLQVVVTGPLGSPVVAVLALEGDTAVIEMAAAAGLGLVPAPDEHTAATATTRGVGELIRVALEHGARHVLLGLGGSATTDGGAGALRALGALLLTADGQPAPEGGVGLAQAAHLDLTRLDQRLAGLDLVVACDVDNPLTGQHGAAVVYGPQKGAGAELVGELDAALGHFADLVAESTGHDFRDRPGAGAAGGLAFGLVSTVGAVVQAGSEVIAELAGLEAVLPRADLLVVGEGSLDAQSLRGKGPVGVARVAARWGVPTIAVVGRCGLDAEGLAAAGLSRVYALTDLEPDETAAMRGAGVLLRRVAALLAADWFPHATGGGYSTDAGVSTQHLGLWDHGLE